MFLANYGDTLTDAPLDEFVERFRQSGKIAAFLCIRPTYSFHLVQLDDDSGVTGIEHVQRSDTWINGGYFLMRREIFDYIRPGEELVEAPFQRLIAEGQLAGYRYSGFWAPMDTLKDKQDLDALYEGGSPPWAVWQRGDRTP
jgi:glucose-1-phosphate cytidylyltransferase